MRQGLKTLLLIVLPCFPLFSQVYVEVKPFNPHIEVDKTPLRINAVPYELIGLELIAHSRNETADKTYLAGFTVFPGTTLPDFVWGWEDKNSPVEAGEKKQLSNIIYIHPKTEGIVTLSFWATLRLGENNFTDELRAQRYEIIINTKSNGLLPASLLSEPDFTPGLENTLTWVSAGNPENISEDAYYFDVQDPVNFHQSIRHLCKALNGDTLRTSFADLINGHTYGYFIRTDYQAPQRVISLSSRIVYSRQDNSAPDPVGKPLALEAEGEVEITWIPTLDTLSGVQRYDIYRALDTGGEMLVHSLDIVGPQPAQFRWYDATAEPGFPYYYRIRAVDLVGNVGDGEISDLIQLSGQVDLPGAPPRTDPAEVLLPNDPVNGRPFIAGAQDTVRFEPIDPRVQRIRFEAVRDRIEYLTNPPSMGGRYFDSGWIEAPFPPYWVFDYRYNGTVTVDVTGQVAYGGDGEELDHNFVDGHTYYRRLTLDFGTTQRADTGYVVPDCFAPSDIRNLRVDATIENPHLAEPDSGYTSWSMTLRWEGVTDAVSGFKRFHIYRKRLGMDAAFVELPLPESQWPALQYVDELSPMDLTVQNTTVLYRVTAEDHIGHKRSWSQTEWEAGERSLSAPILSFRGPDQNPYKIISDDSLFTSAGAVAYTIEGFDRQPVHQYLVSVNGVETMHTNNGQDTLLVPLPDVETVSIKARALYHGGRSSVWTDNKTVIRTRPIPPRSLQVKSDPDSWDGHIYLSWTKPAHDVVFYEVWRWQGSQDSVLVGIDSSQTAQISWTDYYAVDELSGEMKTPLTAYETYTYRVRKVNIFGDRSEFSNMDQSICNKPPQVVNHDIPIIDGSGYVFQVRWSRARPTLVGAGFKTQVRIYLDSLNNQISEKIIVDDDTTTMFRRAEPDHNYIFRIREIPNDTLYPATPWSKPYTVSNLLALEPFHVQPQPLGHIYVDWNSPDLISSYAVEAFQVCRDDTCFRVPHTVTSWMDSAKNLIHGQEYRYRVFALDSLGQIVAANAGTDTSDTGSVFIPEVNPYANKYFNDDSITVSWTWRDIHGNTISDTRGAKRCAVEASLSRSFPDHPDETVRTGPFEVTQEFTSMRVAIPRLGNRENENIYFRIRGEDAWGHPGDNVWSTRFYAIKNAIFDQVPPNPVTDLEVIATRSWYCCADTVISTLRWTGLGTEWHDSSKTGIWDALLANVASYELLRGDGKRLFSTPVVQGIGAYGRIDTLLNRTQNWSIVVIDSAGNQTVSPPSRNLAFIPTPEPPEPDQLRSCELIPVQTDSAGIEYFVEVAMDPDHFIFGYEVGGGEQIDRFLCQSPWLSELSYACTSGWGRIDLDSTWFRVKARRLWHDRWWESAWSYPAHFSAADQAINPKKILSDESLPEQFEIHQNFPNPFNAETKIAFEMPEAGDVQIHLYNINGERVRTLVNASYSAGHHQAIWDGRDETFQSAASGLYLVHVIIEADDQTHRKRFKMMMVK